MSFSGPLGDAMFDESRVKRCFKSTFTSLDHHDESQEGGVQSELAQALSNEKQHLKHVVTVDHSEGVHDAVGPIGVGIAQLRDAKQHLQHVAETYETPVIGTAEHPFHSPAHTEGAQALETQLLSRKQTMKHVERKSIKAPGAAASAPNIFAAAPDRGLARISEAPVDILHFVASCDASEDQRNPVLSQEQQQRLDQVLHPYYCCSAHLSFDHIQCVEPALILIRGEACWVLRFHS